MKRGIHKLKLWPNQLADGNVISTTPSKPNTVSEASKMEKVSTHLKFAFNP